jgi:Zn-dependent M16 (insulinase) family peptidase
MQDPPELLATLPSLTLADLDRTQRTIPTAVETIGSTTVLTHDLYTNGIVYLSLAWDMHRISQELLPYVDLFGQALTQMGTEREDYVKLSQRIGRKTGGVVASSFVSSVMGQEEASAWFTLGGKATLAQAPDMLDIMRDILTTVRLDNRERLKQIVLRNKARMEGSLVPGGHSYVDGRLRAAFTVANWASEQMDGLDNLFFQRALAGEIESNYASVQEKLEAVRDELIARPGMLANVTLDAAGLDEFRPHLARFLEALPAGADHHHAWRPGSYPAHEGLTLPAQVNYVGKGANLYAVGYRHHGSINVIANLIRTGWLWERIRVQGGAYGAFSSFSRHSGVFTFTSYRDPNLLATLDVYDQTADYLRTLELSPTELTRAIIGAISSYDPYLLPDAKGGLAFRRYLVGDTEEEVQRIREEILGTTLPRIRAFGDVLKEAAANARVVVLGSPDAITAANAQRDECLTVQRVM